MPSVPTTTQLDPSDVLIGVPHFRILKWIYQYVAAFPALQHTREDIASMLQAQVEEGRKGATKDSLQLTLAETEHRSTLREIADCLTRDEQLYNAVDPGLQSLLKVLKATGDPRLGPQSSFFHLTLLVCTHAGIQAAADLDMPYERFDDIMRDLLKGRVGGTAVTASEKKEQQAALAKVDKFCRTFRDLSHSSTTAAKRQVAEVKRLYTQEGLVAAVQAVVVDLARGLQLPFPMLDLIEEEFVTRRFKIQAPPLQPPSGDSVVDLPLLPTLTVPAGTATGAKVGKEETKGGKEEKKGGKGEKKGASPVKKMKAVTRVASPAKTPSPSKDSTAVGGQLKAARRNLNRQGVDPLHASIDEATELQEADGPRNGYRRNTRSGPAPAQVVEAMDEDEEPELGGGGGEEQEKEEEEEEEEKTIPSLPITPAPRKRGRPPKSASPVNGTRKSGGRVLPFRAAADSTFYGVDVIDLDDDSSTQSSESEVEEEEEEEDLPGRKKRRWSGGSPAKKARQGKRPVSSRGGPRYYRQWSAEEVEWVKKGHQRYPGQWALIARDEEVRHRRLATTPRSDTHAHSAG